MLERKATVVDDPRPQGGRAPRAAQRFASTGADATARRCRGSSSASLSPSAPTASERTLARGYALIEDPAGEPVTTVLRARSAGELGLRFHDGHVRARVQDTDEDPAS